MTLALPRQEDLPSSDPQWMTGKRRIFAKTPVISVRWPKRAEEANDLIRYWIAEAGAELSRLRLSRDTLHTIASHLARQNGVCPISDRTLAFRSGRSLASTKRDIRHLKSLGFIIAEYQKAEGHKRKRMLKIGFPNVISEHPRTPIAVNQCEASTLPPYVDAYDQGERRNV